MLFRTDDPARWGVGKGANLTPGEVDENFWELLSRVVTLETDEGAPNGISNIAVTGSQMTVYLDDGTALGPYTLPTAMIRYRGDWVSGAVYAELDLVAVPDAGIYLVLRDHTAATTFDANAQDTEGNSLYRWLFPVKGRALGDLSDVDLATTAPIEGDVLGYDATAAAWTPQGPGIADAPADGATYGRLDGAWSPIDTVVDWIEISGVPATIDAIPAAIGTEGQILKVQADGTIAWAGTGGGALDDLSDVTLTTPAAAQFLRYDGAAWINAVVAWADIPDKPATFPPEAHTHPWSEVTGRPATIDAIPATLGAAGTIMKVSADGTTLAWAADEASGTSGALNDLSDVTLTTPASAQVLQYDGTAWINSPLNWAEIPDKPATFPPSAHTHAAADISDFAEGVDDRVAALLVAGTNITLTYDDAAGSLTIASSGGGAGALNDLSDVTLTTPAADQVLQFNGTEWVNSPLGWAEIPDKPATFPPDAHTHPWSDVTDRPATIDAIPPAVGAEGQAMTAQADGSIVWTNPSAEATAVKELTGDYTLVVDDDNTILGFTLTAAATLTIPADATADLPIGSLVSVTLKSNQSLTVQAAAGVALNGVDAASEELTAAYDGLSLYKEAADTWVVQGMSRASLFGLDLIDSVDAAEARATLDAAGLSVPNVFTADQTFENVDDGAGRAPLISYDRLSPTPAAGDALAEFRFHANDSLLAKAAVGGLRAVLDDPTAGAVSGNLSLLTQRAGVFSTRFIIRAGLHAFNVPGGDMGAGTINAAGLYVDGEHLEFEKGTWTPTTSGTHSGTVSSTSGTYTRIGDIVIIQGTINGTGLSFADAGKYMTVGALPFDLLEVTAGSWSGYTIAGLHGVARTNNGTVVYLMGANLTITDTILVFNVVAKIG